MIKSASLALALAAFAPPLALAAGPGGTQPRAWVSGLGSDVSTCGTIKTPCRTFQYAHDSIVAPGGTIFVQDPANYVGTPPFVITHAISIVNDGVGAATIVAPGADAIDVKAGPNDSVFIKGLVLDGAGTGISGVNLASAGSVTIADCTVRGFASTTFVSSGIVINPGAGPLSFGIFDTILTGNGYAGIYTSQGGGGTISGTVKNVRATNNSIGFQFITSSASTVVVVDSVFSQNSYGLLVGGGALSLSNSVATGNATVDIDNRFGTLISYQNNIYGTTNGAIATAAPR